MASSIQECFSNSFLISVILRSNALNATNQLDLNKTKVLFTQMFNAQTTSEIFEIYTSMIFKVDEQIELNSKSLTFKVYLIKFVKIIYCFKALSSIISDCMLDSFKLIGFDRVDVSEHSQSTLKCLINSIDVFIYWFMKIIENLLKKNSQKVQRG